jgi:hypothetical protein
VIFVCNSGISRSLDNHRLLPYSKLKWSFLSQVRQASLSILAGGSPAWVKVSRQPSTKSRMQ